jgi:uncharacterized protein
MLITREELALHSLTINRSYAAGVLDFRDSRFRQIGILRLSALAELAGSDIRLRGRLSARIEAECDRCASPMELSVEPDFDLYYRPVASIAREEEIEIPEDELEVGFYLGAGVELGDAVKEQVILALPMKFLCSPDCRGLCARCGANLNLERCDCPPSRDDSPFARLIGA